MLRSLVVRVLPVGGGEGPQQEMGAGEPRRGLWKVRVWRRSVAGRGAGVEAVGGWAKLRGAVVEARVAVSCTTEQLRP